MPMTIPELPDDVTSEKYWVIKVEGLEWAVAMQRLVEAIPVQEKNEKTVVITMPYEGATTMTFYLLKKVFPVQGIERLTGLPRSRIEDGGPISLTVKPRPDLPKPNVSYWGNA